MRQIAMLQWQHADKLLKVVCGTVQHGLGRVCQTVAAAYWA